MLQNVRFLRRNCGFYLTTLIVCSCSVLMAQDDSAKAFAKAFQQGRPEEVRQLILMPGVNLNARFTSLLDAPAGGLLTWRAKKAPLITAAIYRANGPAQKSLWLDQLRLLLEKGADVNLADDLGRTPLMWASMPGPAENPQSDFDWSAGDAQAMDVLLAAGAQLDLQDQRGATALHYAALFGPSEKVEALIAKGAKLDVPDADGNTPLMYAAGSRVYGLNYMENVKSVRLLIGKGANLDARNAKGETAQNRTKKGSYIDALLAARSPSLSIPDAQTFHPSDPAKALVFVFRRPNFQGSALKPAVFLDDHSLARLQNGRYFAFETTAGAHVLKFDKADKPGVNVEFSAGKVHYIRVLNPWGGAIESPPPDEGWHMIDQAKPVDPDYVKDKTVVIREPHRGL